MISFYFQGQPFATTERRLEDLEPLLRAIGVRLVKTATASFREQKLGRRSWPARSVPNVAGVVNDLKAGGSVKARRFDDRPALIDTGLLRRSISYRVAGPAAVEVGSTLPYAGLHQKGGTSELLVPKSIAPALRQFLGSKRGQKFSGALLKLNVLLRQLESRGRDVTLKIKIPPRPFVGLDEKTERELIVIISRFFGKRRGADVSVEGA